MGLFVAAVLLTGGRCGQTKAVLWFSLHVHHGLWVLLLFLVGNERGCVCTIAVEVILEVGK
jgi:hypothetical protein